MSSIPVRNCILLRVFRCAKKAGLTSAKTEFLGFGTMNGKDGKPYKTREGGVMRLEDLLTTAKNAAKDKLNASAYLSDASEGGKRLCRREGGDSGRSSSGILSIIGLRIIFSISINFFLLREKPGRISFIP